MVGRNILEHPLVGQFEILAPGSDELDLRDFQAVKRWISRHSPDFIIHAAGHVGGIQANMREPVRFLLDNLDLGRNVIWAAREVGVRRLVNLGSSCMYPRNASNPLQEESMLQGELEPTNEGYALSKIVCAKLCEYIGRECPDYQFKTLIPCNIYGRHDKFDPSHSHMVPAILHKLHVAKREQREEVEIWGDGQARREFMYAGDLADCIVRSLRNFDDLPALMNVGIGVDLTIDDYYRAASDVVGFGGRFRHDTTRPVGMQQKLVSIEKSMKWGWRAGTSLAVGLQKTYDFYLQKNQQ